MQLKQKAKIQLDSLSIVIWMTVVFAFILFVCSSLRHLLFQSGFFDLGIYDQVVYLMSQGQPPISSLLGFHHMGNHAAWAVYSLSLLYKIYPSVYWLLAVQAFSLALAAVPTYYLALQAGVKSSAAVSIAGVYLLYPLVFNVNLFEFHPEVMAVPVFLGVVWAARQGKLIWFCLGTIFILGCKAVLSLTVAAMGFWLLVFERRRFCGLFALITGISWFFIATQLIIPAFSNGEAAAVERYAYLGNTVFEIVGNLILQPGIVLTKVFSVQTLGYLVLLAAPVIWGLAPRYLTPLVCAVPTLVLNILSDKSTQRDLIHQYSLPILPFLILVIIATVAADRAWLRRRSLLIWTAIAFLVLAKYSFFWSRYLRSVDNWSATCEAIALVDTKGAVLTTHSIAPHLSHRPKIDFVDDISGHPGNFTTYNYILLNVRHPDGTRQPKFARGLVNEIKINPVFKLVYQRDEVYLFEKL